MSITDELREWMAGFEVVRPRGNGKPAMFDRLYTIADHIDEDHERELLSLRNLAWNNGYDEGFASADDWLAQNEGAMAEHGWVRLPVDADGEIVHVGDLMDIRGDVVPLKVQSLDLRCSGWWVYFRGNDTRPDRLRHHHKATVEDALREYREKATDIFRSYIDTSMTFAERKEAEAALDAEYAERIRKAGGA